jgi:hypothetical protein
MIEMKNSNITNSLDSQLLQTIIAHPLKVSSLTLLTEVVALMSQTGGHCHRPEIERVEDADFLNTTRASCVLVLEENLAISKLVR